jgi:NADH dehydrogenase
LLLAFERAEMSEDDAERRALVTFVVVGAGPTGVELAGQVAEMARTTLRRDFRRIDTAAARVLLVDAGSRVLPQFAESLSARATASLERIGVTVALDRRVMAVGPDAVVLEAGTETEVVKARTVIWAAGVAASALGEALARRTGARTDGGGRPVVAPDLTLPGHPEIRVVGDLAHARDPRPTPRCRG